MLGVFSGVWTKLPLRLAIALCISGRYEEAFYVIAVVCSSWSAVNTATSKRDVLNPYGDQSLLGVRCGNRMVVRRGDPGYTTDLELKHVHKKRSVWLFSHTLQTYKPSAPMLRVALLLVFLEFLGQSWMVENLGSSCILLHPWHRWAIKTIKDFGGHVTKQIK